MPRTAQSARHGASSPATSHLERKNSCRCGWLHRRSWGPASPARISLLVETNSLLLIAGNRSWLLRKGLRISALVPAGESDIDELPCSFPKDQGTHYRDEFATDCPHRHLVCGCGDFARALGHSLRNPRDSAGSWRSGARATEPETAGSRHRRRGSPWFSLLASWAVRIRSRFAWEY